MKKNSGMPGDPFKIPRLAVGRLARSLHAENDVGALEGADVVDHQRL